MDDIFTLVKEGNSIQVRIWLDNTANDLNQGDDHRFSLLHWAAKEGRLNIVDMLIARGARINATNMGDDTALHLACSHGQKEIAMRLMQNKANINAINEHGNTPLHYACFWNYGDISQDLLNMGAQLGIANIFDETPLDKARPALRQVLKDRAVELARDLKKIPFKDRSWLGSKTRSRDATLSRYTGIKCSQLKLAHVLANTHSGRTLQGVWQGSEIVAKELKLRECTLRMSRDFQEEFPRLRIFNHANILPVLACCNERPNLVVISQYMVHGSLYNVLHGETDIVVDQNQALRFALDIARGMEFLHSMEPMIPNIALNSKHVMIDEDLAKINIDDPKYSARDVAINGIDEDLTARINMADYRFSFHEKGKIYSPAWMAPEALQKKPEEMNVKAADMWSYAILLWEMETREVPFADLSPMEIGMKITLEDLRIKIPPGISSHMSTLLKICMNEEPGRRPKFDMIIPILEKMRHSS
ncbi:integrin-linked protein kinase isoform X1 [Octopus sinensis]|uniref:Integrin-linked protein kinase isoform X1 n=1 Tax=Octopus sinensis TaxID=2607531 RepID=A0A6P7TCQ3_9MOLL|nr:integrin-linked protein kinase isoform X1 [Octopus sinensis]